MSMVGGGDAMWVRVLFVDTLPAIADRWRDCLNRLLPSGLAVVRSFKLCKNVFDVRMTVVSGAMGHIDVSV